MTEHAHRTSSSTSSPSSSSGGQAGARRAMQASGAGAPQRPLQYKKGAGAGGGALAAGPDGGGASETVSESAPSAGTSNATGQANPRRSPHRNVRQPARQHGNELEWLTRAKAEGTAREAEYRPFFEEPSKYTFWTSVAKEAVEHIANDNLLIRAASGAASTLSAHPGHALKTTAFITAPYAVGKDLMSGDRPPPGSQAEAEAQAGESIGKVYGDPSTWLGPAAGSGTEKLRALLVSEEHLPQVIEMAFQIADKSFRADARFKEMEFYTLASAIRQNEAVRAHLEAEIRREIGARREAHLEKVIGPELNQVLNRYDNLPSATVDAPRPERRAEAYTPDEPLPEEHEPSR